MFLAINIAEISCVLCPVINQMFWSVLIILPSSAGLTSISYDQSEIGAKLKFLSAPNKLHIKKLKTNYCFENNDRSAGTAPYLICIEFNVESSYSAQQCWVLVKSWVSKNFFLVVQSFITHKKYNDTMKMLQSWKYIRHTGYCTLFMTGICMIFRFRITSIIIVISRDWVFAWIPRKVCGWLNC